MTPEQDISPVQNAPSTAPTTSPARPASPAKKAKAAKPAGIRQTMSDLHTWTGLLLGWVLYAMFLTGTVSYFREEISQWMRPEVAHSSTISDPATAAQRVVDHLTQTVPHSPQWGMRLPNARSDTVDAFWRLPKGETNARGRNFGDATFDPHTGDVVKGRDTRGGEFFYRFHFQFHYMPVIWGRWLAGFAAMFMLVAIVSGVITHKKIFADFFTFRWGKGQRSWLDAHNALSVFGLPFHLMITYTGLVTLMALYMPWGDKAAFPTPEARQELTAQLSAFRPALKPTGEKAALAPVTDMVHQAQQRWGEYNVSRVNVTNAGDTSARVVLLRGDGGRVSTSPQYMVFNGATGELLDVQDKVGAAAETRGVLFALHLGRFGDVQMRWLYFLVSLAGTAMVGTGLVMWNVKRRQKLPNPDKPHFGFRVVERLNIATMAGLSIAMAGLLWANRLLPIDLAQRANAEVDVFFAIWALTLLYAMARPAKRAWIELLWIATAALALLPVLNALTTDRPLWRSIANGDWVFVGMDLMCLALAALHAQLALRTARHQPRVKAARPAARAAVPAASTPRTAEQAG